MRFKKLPKTFILVCALHLAVPVSAQTLISPAGSSATLTGGSVSWSIGEMDDLAPAPCPAASSPRASEQPNTVKVRMNIAALLQGPYNNGNSLMDDGLRSGGLVPLTEPFTALGYGFVGGGGESTTAPVLAITGNDAIVDWILLELRDATDATIVLASRSALVQRDGDVVDIAGSSPVTFDMSPGNYHVAMLHRNHLGIMTFAPLALGDQVTDLDFTTTATPTYGTDARKDIGGTQVLWAGDVTFNGQVKYTGAGNDRDPILQAIGGLVPTNTAVGYLQEDVNLNGEVKYTGAANDRDPILQNIGGVVPTNSRTEQVP